MSDIFVYCFYCGKKLYRSLRRMNENKKMGWKIYCSSGCLSKNRTRGVFLVCENPDCQKEFKRPPKAISNHNYCSHSCAAQVNNSKRIRTKVCPTCGKTFHGKRKYCLRACLRFASPNKGVTKYTKEIIEREIQNFVKDKGRLPVKREKQALYKPARNFFGTWNNAIKTAGFDPNPVMFANKHRAKDGHFCDSLAEKIIDDYLNERGIKHERNVTYPGDQKFTADFKIEDSWIEFFGLQGELKRYDELRIRKLRLIKKYKLKLIEIFPKDIFSGNRLNELFPSFSN